MSNSDSFIEEVSEELRRDQLFAYFRRYGWIAALVILLIVGGAAWNEWRKAQDAARAQALGDAMLDAMATGDAAARAEALAAVPAEGAAAAVAAMLLAAEQDAAEAPEAAIATLTALSDNGDVPPVYRDLARLKALILGAGITPVEERRAGFETLAVPGRPFRMPALEQLAILTLEEDDPAASRAAFEALVDDAEASEGLRERARAMIVALGGDVDAAPATDPEAVAAGSTPETASEMETEAAEDPSAETVPETVPATTGGPLTGEDAAVAVEDEAAEATGAAEVTPEATSETPTETPAETTPDETTPGDG